MSAYRTTIRVFEHERLKIGDRRRGVDGAEVVFQARDFDALAFFSEKQPRPLFEIGHRSVRFSNFVGYLEVGALGIEILPKADRGVRGPAAAPWRDALLDMIAVAYGLRLFQPMDARLALRDGNLFDVYIQRFLSEVETLVHRGLVRGYRRVHENRSAFRGRLLVAENIRKNLVLAQRIFVEHEIYDHDILVNQALQAALAVLDRSSLGGSLRSRLVRARGAFPEHVSDDIDLVALDRMVLTRNTEPYAMALRLARLILEHRAPTLRAGRTQVLALLFDMNALWERYVAALLRRSAPDSVRVIEQDGRRFWKAPRARVRKVRPDILVTERAGEASLVLDTKWKVPARGNPSDDDLKQMFVYNELYACSRSLLVYPQASGAEACDGAFHSGGHACGTRFLSFFDDAGRYSRAVAIEQVLGLLQDLPARSG